MTYVETFLKLLRLFHARGAVTLDFRSPAGFGHTTAVLEPAALDAAESPAVMTILQRLADGYTCRLVPVTTRDVLPVLFVRWPMAFDLRHRHFVVRPDAEAHVHAALALGPPVSVLVRAGPETWAGWKLHRPVSAVDAGPVLRRLAERLGGDGDAIQDVTAVTLPAGGRIRNWGDDPVKFITVAELDTTRCYDVAQLVEPNTVPPTTRGHYS